MRRYAAIRKWKGESLSFCGLLCRAFEHDGIVDELKRLVSRSSEGPIRSEVQTVADGRLSWHGSVRE